MAQMIGNVKLAFSNLKRNEQGQKFDRTFFYANKGASYRFTFIVHRIKDTNIVVFRKQHLH